MGQGAELTLSRAPKNFKFDISNFNSNIERAVDSSPNEQTMDTKGITPFIRPSCFFDFCQSKAFKFYLADAPLSNTYACEGDEFSLHFLLDFLSLCESSGFIQLKLSFSQLKEKVTL